MAGQSGCTYSMQCIRDFENRGKARIHYKKKGCCSPARETNKNKKVTFKVQQGLNFPVDVVFGFATMISVKLPEGKKNAYCVVFYDVKNSQFCSCTN